MVPSLWCRCGYIHNLSPIPDEGYVTFPDLWTEALLYDEPTDLDPEQLKRSVRHLYECPNCAAVYWQHEDGYRLYVPAGGPPRVYADFSDVDDLDGVHLRHPQGLRDIEQQRLILHEGLPLVIYDDSREKLASVEAAAVRVATDPDEYEYPSGQWVAREPR